jgi:toxin ParE1/3/4
MAYRLTPSAKRDLAEIFAYYEERAGLDAADHLIDSITERFSLLSDFPGAGRSAGDLGAGVRCFPVGRYLVYYRKARRDVVILRVLHGARNQQRSFRKHG